jgi:hypothetical protein
MTNGSKTGHVFPKQQLEIVQAPTEKPYGTSGKTLVTLNAKNNSLFEGDPLIGKALKYTAFNISLKAYILKLKVGTCFLADIEERDRPNSEYGPDRNIIQIYVENKPISVKKGSGGGFRRSLEDDLALEAVKRRSIEGQTAVAQVGNFLTCPTPIEFDDLEISKEDWTRILRKYWKAIEKSLDNYLDLKTEYLDVTTFGGPKATYAVLPTAHEDAQGKRQAAAPPAIVSDDTLPTSDPIKHAGDLLTRALKLKPPVTREDLCVAFGINDPSEIADLESAWEAAQELSELAKAKQEAEKIF